MDRWVKHRISPPPQLWIATSKKITGHGYIIVSYEGELPNLSSMIETCISLQNLQ